MADSQKQDGPQLTDNRDFRLPWLGQGLSQVGTRAVRCPAVLPCVSWISGRSGRATEPSWFAASSL